MLKDISTAIRFRDMANGSYEAEYECQGWGEAELHVRRCGSALRSRCRGIAARCQGVGRHHLTDGGLDNGWMQVELEGQALVGMPRKLIVQGPDVSKCLLDGEGLSSAKAGSPKPTRLGLAMIFFSVLFPL